MNHSRIQIRIADDGMSAFVSISRGAPEGGVELNAALGRAGVRFGIDEEVQRHLSQELGQSRFEVTDVLIASGAPAVSCRDAAFEPAFHAREPAEAGAAEPKDVPDRARLDPVRTGQLLGRMEPPRSGSAGIGVDGRPQPILEEQTSEPQLGSGTVVHADGRVTAARPGTIVYRPHAWLDVVEERVHAGNVDLRSGNLCTDGSLVIGGDVKRAFGVRVAGNLEIRGAVESGSVYAGGVLRVHGGVGGGDGILLACADLRARYAERTTLICGGILALDRSVYCTLEARTIEVLHALHGGKASAELSIRAEQAGSPNSSVETVLIAGLPLPPPELPDQPVIVQTLHEIASLPHRESERPLSAASMVMLASKPPTRTWPPPPHPGSPLSTAPASARPRASTPSVSSRPPTTLARAPSARPTSGSSVPLFRSSLSPPSGSLSAPRSSTAPPTQADAARAAAEQAARQKAHAQRLLDNAFIEISGVAHAGVIVQIGDARLILDQALRNVRFSLDPSTRTIRTSPARG